ncbi:hypothetical protein FLAV_01745 [Flavobacteriales bacterium]|nr:hypothetical protein [Flavobacteriales bacterium]CAG0980572.1 hypothetical protein FLAV_01745 [Flavobacteriales bacterium]
MSTFLNRVRKFFEKKEYCENAFTIISSVDFKRRENLLKGFLMLGSGGQLV